MTYDQTTRPTFYDSQYLGANNLNAIVDYGHVQMARHLLGGHAWGIATGLELVEQPVTATGTPPKGATPVSMFINPGYAWDGFGRPVVALAPVQISESLFAGYPFHSGQPNGYPIKIWLQYQEIAGQSPAPGFGQCDANQYGAVQESYQIVVGDQNAYANGRDPISFAGFTVDASATPSVLDPTVTTMIADASVPDQTFPDPIGSATWLIPLGYVLWYPATASQPGMFLARANVTNVPSDDSLRVPVGVVAGSVLAVEESIRMRRRTDTPTTVLSNDLVWVEGPLRVDGDARVFGGALKFLTGSGDGDPGSVAPLCSPSPPNASPFSLPLMITREDCSSNSYLEIVIGQGTSGKFTGASSLQIGPLDAKTGKLLECVTVLDNGNVGIGTPTPPVPLSFPQAVGDKIALTSKTGDINYCGFGIGKSTLQIYTDTSATDIVFGTGNSGTLTENVRITGTGNIGVGNPKPPAPLSFAPTGGDKIVLWTQDNSNYDGLGIDTKNNLLQIYCDAPTSDIAFGTGNSALFTEQVRITGGGNVGIGTKTPGFPLSFPNTLGDKIALWGQSASHYGLGIQSGLLQIYCDVPTSAIAFGYGSSTSFTELMRIKGDGGVTFASGLNAVAAPEPSLMMIRGTVNSAGVVIEGTGFTIASTALAGTYSINFAPAFGSAPSGAVTPHNTSSGISVVIVSITGASVTLLITDSGTPATSDFTFVFVGPR